MLWIHCLDEMDKQESLRQNRFMLRMFAFFSGPARVFGQFFTRVLSNVVHLLFIGFKEFKITQRSRKKDRFQRKATNTLDQIDWNIVLRDLYFHY